MRQATLEEMAARDSDTYMFLPSDGSKGVYVETGTYKDEAPKLDGNTVGDCYHIILFQTDEVGKPIHLDKFEAILMAPIEYISRLIPDDWYGLVAKKTTTSHKFVDETFDKLQGMC